MVFWGIFAPFSAVSEILLLSPGEKTHIPLSPNKAVHVGSRKIISLSSQGGRLGILGKRPGQTRLSLGGKSYQIHVLSLEQKRKTLLAAGLLKGFWGLDWSLSEDSRLLIKGALNRLFDWVKLAETARAENISYEFLAGPGEGLEPAIKKFFEDMFSGRPAPEIQWSRLPFALIPKGGDTDFYARKLKPYGLVPKEDEGWFSRPPFIEIEIALVENGLSSSFSFGGAAGGFSPQSGAAGAFASLLSFLNFMKASGKGQTIHHSSIFTQSGQEAHVHSGGQIPFSVYHAESDRETVQWKSYGFSLQVSPVADKKGSIQLKISGEISEPSGQLSSKGPPPLKRQSLKTTVWARDGGIFALFRQRKKGSGALSHGGLGGGGLASSLPFLKPMLHKRNQYSVSRFILMRPKILKKGGGK